MKYYLLLFALLMGCGESREEMVAHNVKSLMDNPREFHTIEIEGCEYIIFHPSKYGGVYFTHKGNCKNHSLHRDWMRELSEKQNNTIGK